MDSPTHPLVIGVDVGTGSARAGVFDLQGRRRGIGTCAIRMWKPHPDWAEQSTEDIWTAIGTAVRGAMSQAGAAAADVVGIGFDATCSMAVLGANDQPLAVSASGEPGRNVIVWMDQRAVAETAEINRGGYDVLKYVGGRLSPEMQTPKLLWLKRHLPQTYNAATGFFDLADYLTYRCTGDDTRSLCTTVCKWTYLGQEGRWDENYFKAIGLDDLLARGAIGTRVRPMGEKIGPLTAAAAADLGLSTNCQVAVGMIDAHAGGVGVLGATDSLRTSLALIGGTSSCHMAVSDGPRFVPGVWGPYYSAMIPGLWLTEGGQSATGVLIDFVLQSHARYADLKAEAAEQGGSVYERINARAQALAGLKNVALISKDLHVLDHFLGNRSPMADPQSRGSIDGLPLDDSLDSLTRLYVATVQAVAYGTRAIIDAMNASGYAIDRIFAVGGGTKNPLWLQQHADALGLPIHLPEEPESVLLGSAILAAAGSGQVDSIEAGMQAMGRSGAVVPPDISVAKYHAAKYAIYREMYEQQKGRRERMAAF